VSVTQRIVKGTKTWVIDRRFRRPDGKTERYRRAAKVQIKAAAIQEEAELILEFRSKGTIAHLLGMPLLVEETEQPPAPNVETKVYLWEDAVAHYREHRLPVLKAATRRNYSQCLDGAYLAYFAGKPLADIDYTLIEQWDAWVRKSLPNDGSRRREHIALHAVLRSIGPNPGGKWIMLEKVPLFPAMPTGSKKKPAIPSIEDVRRIMSEGNPDGVARKRFCRQRALERAQLAFGLSLWAGLRAGEIRALRKSDIDMVSRVITVKHSRSYGVVDTSKGEDERSIKIADVLWARLEPRLNEMTDSNGIVCLSYEGRPWSDWALWQAWVRTCKRLGIKRTKFHAARHFFLTKMFTFGASPITVMTTAGHKDLKTTLRYAHYEQADQDKAISQFSAR